MRIDYTTVNTPEELYAAARRYFEQATRGRCMPEGDGACTYRWPHERDAEHTCVVGAFLPDELWVEKWNEASATELLTDMRQVFDHPFLAWFEANLRHLRVLQAIHDKPENWSNDTLSGHGWERFDEAEREGCTVYAMDDITPETS
jgi:hypothetical protein